ncbi:MAG: aminoglycoside phosphotransferase family protein [Fimbriimonadales bacterium]|nr:aminoglycoside phosphotransferase family protein [Fimbriimonadales bacterium]
MIRSHQDPAQIAGNFRLCAPVVAVERVGIGHINDSYRVRTGDGRLFLLQRINTGIFHDPEKLMDNIVRVIDHLAQRCESERDRRVLTLVPTANGHPFFEFESAFWRMYVFIDGTYIHRAVQGPGESRTAGRAFGRFQAMLHDLSPQSLHETIEGFHDTPARFEVFEKAVEVDAFLRVRECETEIQFAMDRATLSSELVKQGLPTRIAHNDAKISNVLLDTDTDEALCVVDLDTVMAGSSLFDFGDMIRTMTTGKDEDEADYASVRIQTELFRALVEGYLSEANAFLTEDERRLLVTSGMVITYEQGLRFLTDYLSGDVYYRQSFPSQNLQRARAQFALLASMELERSKLEQIVRNV